MDLRIGSCGAGSVIPVIRGPVSSSIRRVTGSNATYRAYLGIESKTSGLVKDLVRDHALSLIRIKNER